MSTVVLSDTENCDFVNQTGSSKDHHIRFPVKAPCTAVFGEELIDTTAM